MEEESTPLRIPRQKSGFREIRKANAGTRGRPADAAETKGQIW